jgi:hypothetical protein
MTTAEGGGAIGGKLKLVICNQLTLEPFVLLELATKRLPAASKASAETE